MALPLPLLQVLPPFPLPNKPLLCHGVVLRGYLGMGLLGTPLASRALDYVYNTGNTRTRMQSTFRISPCVSHVMNYT